MVRNIEKLVKEYQRKYYNAPPNSKRGQLYVSDYYSIMEIAGVENTDEAWSVVGLALMAGIMIGYNARKAEEREIRKRGKKNEA